MPSRTSIADSLAAAFVAGPWRLDELVERGERLLGKRWRWIRPLARRLIQSCGAATMRPSVAQVASLIYADRRFHAACDKHEIELPGLLNIRPMMSPVSGPSNVWPVSQLKSPGELARWLELSPNELDWLADCRLLETKVTATRLRHYHYRWMSKRTGGERLIESPKARLKALQRRVLHEILEVIPPHAAAHGFRRGRSIKTFTAPHVQQRVVLKIDLEDFFPSIHVARVRAVFRAAGYPEAVARLLAGLCTNAAPADVWPGEPGLRDPRHWHTLALYGRPHLPQGAPSSPALANLCAYRLDCRLDGLARAVGACYTRYADDLVFSGGRELERSVKRFHIHACATVMEEGFSVQTRKTRIMREGVRQRAAGVVLNRHQNVCRVDYDRLRATLHNCIRHGPSSQNRSGHGDFQAHLSGRISHVESLNPVRGRRLRDQFNRIDWR
jgi:RNA-directed DNA polymerase